MQESVNELIKPIKQMQLHENLVLKMQKLVIVNFVPSFFDRKLVGMMISISVQGKYNLIFTRKEFPGGFFVSLKGRLFLLSLAYLMKVLQ